MVIHLLLYLLAKCWRKLAVFLISEKCIFLVFQKMVDKKINSVVYLSIQIYGLELIVKTKIAAHGSI